MKKLLIEVENGIMDNTAYVYDSDGNKICEGSGGDNYKAIQNVCLKLPEEYLDKAITQYYRGGLVKLKIFIVGIIRFNHIK